jgi:hypothetical protein
MKLNKRIPFEHEGKNYEIHIFSDGWKFKVKAYLDGQPVNGYSYSVELPTAFDLQTVISTDAIQTLIDIAKEDVVSNKWEKYVKGYIQNMQVSEENVLGCQNCSNRKIVSKIVDDRKMFECQQCGNIWYEERKTVGAYQIILDEIVDGVEKNKSHNIFTVVLLNTVFSDEEGKGLSFEEQLNNWAKQNKLGYERFTGKDAQGSDEEITRFYSVVPRVSPPFKT